ncbi:MAG: hypothetical protein AUJ04_05845 [Acidobacteria bacterium 13_1_40CM_3_55_6]|nr:MAG: hypothetical protein AUJ04_05845 [Acidobacteria bacterium 13_1_40CM_3_55_6]
MKLTMVAVASSLICITAVSTALARKPSGQPTVAVAGIYDNFTVGKESGDLEGMRVVIVSAGGGYYAIVQIAQGGAEDPKPEFVAANVKGMSVQFTAGSEKFRGTVSAAGLTLQVRSSGSLCKKGRFFLIHTRLQSGDRESTK